MKKERYICVKETYVCVKETYICVKETYVCVKESCTCIYEKLCNERSGVSLIKKFVYMCIREPPYV